jgi:hypothetical protein
VVIIVGFLFLGALLELGFRNQGNFDWLMHTEWCNDYFTNNGFREKGYENETSSHPTTLFERDDCLVKVKLNAALLNPLYTIDIIVNEKRMHSRTDPSVHYGLTLDLVNPAFLREKAGVFCNKAALLDDKGGLRLISCQCCDFCQQSLCF